MVDSASHTVYCVPYILAVFLFIYLGWWFYNFIGNNSFLHERNCLIDMIIVLFVQTIFFAELSSSETRKLVERLINYVIYKVNVFDLLQIDEVDLYRFDFWDSHLCYPNCFCCFLCCLSIYFIYNWEFRWLKVLIWISCFAHASQ